VAYYYGINKGTDESTATVATSTTSKDVEIVVNSTNVTTRNDLLMALEKLENAVLKLNWPPA
jgi:NACalpha-BTF3-like transcription factor